jgi:hypothetical protein
MAENEYQEKLVQKHKQGSTLVKVLLFPYRALVVVVGTAVLIYLAYLVAWDALVRLTLFLYHRL